MDVLFDRQSYDLQIKNVPLQNQGNTTSLQVFLGYDGESATLYKQINELLKIILYKDGDLRFGIGPRQARRVSLVKGNGEVLSNIFQLSTGESLVLNLGLSIIRDFDLCESKNNLLDEIRGLVVIDEVDLHLHADFQFTVLPQLLRLFPKIQFLMTSHSPLFLMGMRKVFGKEGFVILSMPEMTETDPEAFSEFEQAYRIYKESVTYTAELDTAILSANKPAFFLEGPIDIRYLRHACALLGQEKLLQEISLFDGDGFGNLNNIWKHFNTRLSHVFPWIVTLIYDCDIQKINSDNGNLKRRVLSEILENPVKKGIENLFSREILERARAANPSFIDITPTYTKQVRGCEEVVPESWEINTSEKTNLCDWLIKHGTADDFQGFVQILDIICEFVPQGKVQPHG